ncbi:unnamed protein product [Rodentolepis nana]|uniref:Uncharacterized protein n=1 Tax=Rodentolepis nana TaxID=102285 RepID=A0A3P7V8H4_RODNA|nr:unnamed protein product [Rodentolepis nana]
MGFWLRETCRYHAHEINKNEYMHFNTRMDYIGYVLAYLFGDENISTDEKIVSFMTEHEAVPVKSLPEHPKLKAINAYPWEIANAVKLIVPQLHIFEMKGVGELIKRIPSVLPKSAYPECQ